MTRIAELQHHVPGRLRLRLPFAKGDPAGLESIRAALADLSGVRRVDARTLTATVVIAYDPAQFSDFPGTLEQYAERHGLFALGYEKGNNGPDVSDADRSIQRAVDGLNRKMQQAFGNAINLKELLPIAVGLYGFWFVDKTAAAAQWLNWIQFAFDTYIDLHEGEPVAGLSQKVDALGIQVLEQQAETAEALRAELAALREEIRLLAARPPAPA